MTTYFKKITSLSLPVAKPESIKGRLVSHYGANRYHEISDNTFRDAILNTLLVQPMEIFFAEAVGPLNCHTDNGVTTVLNYYLRTLGYITEFWEPKENARRITNRRYEELTDTYNDVILGYEKDDCTLKDSFFAEIGDIYFMDSTKVHSVSRKVPYHLVESRAFIQCQWRIEIDKLLPMLKLEI